MLQPVIGAALELQKDSISAEIIDLLTISPLDNTLMIESITKTGRAVVVHEAPQSFGPGAEIITQIMEGAFYYLEAPIERVTGYDTIIPYFSREKEYLPSIKRIVKAAKATLKNHS
jgi:pyruvate dehydrogenase E1 component beta subunit